MDNHIFRTAIGGFNRQDVTGYIEKSQKAAAAEAEALEKELEELRGALEAAREELEQARTQQIQQTAELADRRERLEAETIAHRTAQNNWDAQVMANAALQKDLAQRDAALQDLRKENAALAGRVSELEGRLESLRREKERVAQLELDAHQRSDAIVIEAERKAKETVEGAAERSKAVLAAAGTQAEEIVARARERAEALLREAEERVADTAGRYNELHQSFEAIVSHISSELRKLDVTAGQLPISFNHLKQGLAELLERTKER